MDRKLKDKLKNQLDLKDEYALVFTFYGKNKCKVKKLESAKGKYREVEKENRVLNKMHDLAVRKRTFLSKDLWIKVIPCLKASKGTKVSANECETKQNENQIDLEPVEQPRLNLKVNINGNSELKKYKLKLDKCKSVLSAYQSQLIVTQSDLKKCKSNLNRRKSQIRNMRFWKRQNHCLDNQKISLQLKVLSWKIVIYALEGHISDLEDKLLDFERIIYFLDPETRNQMSGYPPPSFIRIFTETLKIRKVDKGTTVTKLARECLQLWKNMRLEDKEKYLEHFDKASKLSCIKQ